MASGGTETHLLCSLADYYTFPLNEIQSLGPTIGRWGMGVSPHESHIRPDGLVALKADDPVSANNDHVGGFAGVVVSDSYDLKKILVFAHHLLHRRTVAVPADYFVGVGLQGVDLALTKQQLDGLPDIA